MRVTGMESSDELDAYGRKVSLSDIPNQIQKIIYKAIELRRVSLAQEQDCMVEPGEFKDGES